MSRLFGTTLALCIAGTAAIAGGKLGPAQEPAIVAPPVSFAPARSYDWTGPYVGLTLGYGRAEWDADPGATPAVTGGSTSSVGGALHAGYHMDMGAWVSGIELELLPGALAPDAEGDDRELDFGARLKLRGGPKFGQDGRTFVYGTAGVVAARISIDGGGSSTDAGWLAGVGVAHAWTDNLFVTGEVTHNRINDAFDTDSDVRGNVATLGVSMRF